MGRITLSAVIKFKPHSVKQDLAIHSKKRIKIIATGIQWGKGVHVDHGVLTREGYVPARHIKQGDIVYDRDGKETEVVGVYPQGKRDCYRLKFTDGKSAIFDDQHLHIIKPRGDRDERVESTKEIFRKRHYLNKAQIPAIRYPIDLPKKEFYISPYVMGCLLGDGGLSAGAVVFSKSEYEVIERFERELPDGHVLGNSETNDFRIIYPQVNRQNPLKDELSRLGLMGKKSEDKFIPDSYLFSSIEQRIDLLHGLMDTDGTAKKNKYLEYYTVSERLKDGVTWLVESLGGKCSYTIKKTSFIYNGKRRAGQDCYRLKIISPLVNPFYLSRKRAEYFVHENTPNKVLSSIEYMGEQETVCFEVSSKTKSFIIEGQIATHNTTSSALTMKMKMHEFTDKSDNFIMTAPNYKIMQQATLPEFLRLMQGFGEWRKGDAVFEMYNGGTCYMRTSTDPDSVVGITNVRHITGDEAGLFPLYFHENLQARSSIKECQIVYSTSPYSLNWLYIDYIRPRQKDPNFMLEDLELIQARSDENPFFPQAEFLRKKATMDPRRFNMIYGGEFNKVEGLVYDCFDEDVHVVDPHELEPGTIFVAGVDWGYTAPAAISVLAVTPNFGVYLVAEHYKTQQTIGDMIEAAQMFKNIYKIERFYCDPASPANIVEFNKAGLTAVSADNDIRSGVDAFYELIATGKFHVFKGRCPHFLDEISIYHYPTEIVLTPDRDDKDRLPVKQWDHMLDSCRYPLFALKNANPHKRRQPRVPGSMDVDLRHHAVDHLLKRRVQEEFDW